MALNTTNTESTTTNQINTGAYDTARTQAINDMYDAQKQSQLSQLESAYNQSKSEYDAAAAKIPTQYQQSANDVSTQYEKQRQAFNRQAMANGINSGTGSQAALARSGQYQRDLGTVRTNEANALTENQRQQANLKAQYESNVATALADNNYQRAQALIDEYNNGYNRQMQEAQNLAAMGDFSGYGTLYGQERADTLQKIWNAQNPDIAWSVGNITAEEYKTMTGKYPKGYSRGGTSSPNYYNPYGTNSTAISTPQGTTTVSQKMIGDVENSAYGRNV